MNGIETTALGLLSSVWVLQSAVAVIKTRKARRLFVAHRAWIDRGVEVPETKRVALIIAVKGVSENFDRFLDFVLGQDYPDYRVIFVTESEEDPAHVALRGVDGSECEAGRGGHGGEDRPEGAQPTGGAGRT